MATLLEERSFVNVDWVYCAGVDRQHQSCCGAWLQSGELESHWIGLRQIDSFITKSFTRMTITGPLPSH